MERTRRIAVIGVGVLGACVGWNLSRQGAEVVLIDAGRPGEGVTDWSFSWANASNKTVRRSYFDLNVAGLAAHRELAATIGPDSWWYPTGHLRWADDPAAEAKFLETAELLVSWDYRVEMSTGAEVRRRLEPALALPDEVPVLFYPDEAWVHGRHLVGRLVGQAVAAGAELRSGTEVRDIGTDADGGVRTVALSDGSSLDVDVVVNAAGPNASHVAGLVARHLPMRREPGVVTRIDCAPVPIHRAMHAPHIEIRPDGDGSMVLHSREIDALIDTGEEPAELARLLHESVRQVVPELADSRIAQARVAERPIPADGFPSVGAVPSVPGYYEAVSHSGITLGPVLGRLLAAEILGGESDELLADFRPERFSD
ncbi:NAD(P)/FAD-dependent oxidoreductase [Streptomyces pseudovenezuelae]|uniref:Glycine/D-amino acid oxidase-like deaminating enzyme n=1 Tax=Streptomyces pseudovenezuelae TaxID=67350 RepID=A0ABT6LGX7_9ACTN|nr:FAD-dependent oxidoreductase [Streptomyces pseudovenezuelae]MDH6215551.1 glycine/D-amino acid oxidase-like deaminating enzyme [Streptomyces pseudovenezuelae]